MVACVEEMKGECYVIKCRDWYMPVQREGNEVSMKIEALEWWRSTAEEHHTCQWKRSSPAGPALHEVGGSFWRSCNGSGKRRCERSEIEGRRKIERHRGRRITLFLLLMKARSYVDKWTIRITRCTLTSNSRWMRLLAIWFTRNQAFFL